MWLRGTEGTTTTAADSSSSATTTWPRSRRCAANPRIRIRSSLGVKFAARSEPVEKLSQEEHSALEEYVKFLCER
jgi:hypothetical protein